MAGLMKGIFNSLETHKAMKEIIKAIRAGDNAQVSALFKQGLIKPDTAAYDGILVEAIKKDDVEIYKTLAAVQEDPNYYIYSKSAPVSTKYGSTETFEHVLNVAIRMGSKNIALDLVSNKEIALREPGYQKTVMGFAPFKPTKALEYPLDLAKQTKGMGDVVNAIKAREAASYTATKPPSPQP